MLVGNKRDKEDSGASTSAASTKSKDIKPKATLNDLKQEMNYYRGQKYNPVEDDNITTESMFKVINADTGEAMDVRDMLGITEEEFKNNPDLLNALVHMNNIQPIDSKPKA